MAEMSDKEVVDWIIACREEADEAKGDRMMRNKANYDEFHLRHDFSHKEEGQSTEVLSKQSMAVEQIKSFFQQALVDIGDWWSAESNHPNEEAGMLIKPDEITKLTNYMLENASYFSHVGNTVESALLGALGISKTYGVMESKPRYIAKKKGRGKSYKKWIEKIEDKTWRMKFECVRAENYYPDPSGKDLYRIEDMWVDAHEVMALAEGDDAIYDKAALSKVSLASTSDDSEENFDRARETGQNTYSSSHRPKYKLTEYWGKILNKTTGEVIYDNCVATVANDTHLIRKPTPNPLWHQRTPYNASPLMEVPNSVWHKAPMDAPTCHNSALTEIYNLIVDAGMQEVHAVKQLRKDMLDDPAQVANGIKPGTTLSVSSALPVGGKVMEDVTAVKIPNEVFNVYNIMNQEFNASALTNDLRQGVMPFRAVKATEVVEASQTITSVFQGMAKNYEVRQSTKELELAWMTTAQNWDKISKEEFVSLFGAKRGEELSQLEAQDVFASTVNGIRFRVYGISLTLSKAQDFRKYSTLMQTVFSNQILAEEFMKKYDPGLFLGEIMNSLDIDKHKIEIPEAVQATMQAPPEGEQSGMAGPEQGGPDINSQIPQAGAGSLADLFGGPQIPQTSFPSGGGQ